MKVKNKVLENGIAFHGDAFDVLNDFIDKEIKVDAAIIDPPYGTIRKSTLHTNNSKLTAHKYKGNEGDTFEWDIKLDWFKFFDLLNKVVKPGGNIIMFGQHPTFLNMILANQKNFKYELIWFKNASGNNTHAKNKPSNYHENIAVFINGETKQENRTYNYKTRKTGEAIVKSSVLRYPKEQALRIHPTQKPIKLLMDLIEMYTNKGETIIDTFAGSHSLAIAAQRLGRHFITIEKNDKYYKNGIEWILKDSKHKPLF